MNKTISLTIIIGILLSINLNVNAQLFGKSAIKASIAGVSSGEISRDILLQTKSIECSDKNFEIIYFSLSAMKSGDLIVYTGTGNIITESMKSMIKSLEPGSNLIIEQIGARSSLNNVIKLQAIELKIN